MPPMVGFSTDDRYGPHYGRARSARMENQQQRVIVAMIGRARGSIKERPWWGVAMSEDTYVGLVREIEIAKGRISAHEKECTLRYQNIETTMSDVKSDVAAILCKVDAQTAGANKWVLSVAAALIFLLLGGLGWSTGQLYQIQTQGVISAAQLK